MKTTILGRGGPAISQIGIGAMSFAGIYGDATEVEAFATMDACREAGVTHIDTSNVYGMGRSEDILGRWFASRTGVRADMVLATKAGITDDPDRRINNDPDHLESALDASLKRLGVDHVDLFYVHRFEGTRPIEAVAETLKSLIDKGKTRAVGLSEIAPSTLRRASAICPIAAVQSEYSLSTRYPELGLVQTCAELGTALVAFSPLGRALLTDTPISRDRIKATPFLAGNPRFTEPNLSANLKITDGFRALAAEMGEPAAALAIAWLISRGDHVLPIPGTRNTAHLAELVRGTEIDLTPSDLARIETVLPVGWAHGDRYNAAQWDGPERYC